MAVMRTVSQVSVDIVLCGVRGSDLHSPDLPQVYRSGSTLGPEAAGVLSWVGDHIEGGQRADASRSNPNDNLDGTCECCRAGRPNFCRRATMETARVGSCPQDRPAPAGSI
ncbi:MAG: alcohol dehydrogenase catalytic domain-containing protein [Janthinobacterium lividum]